MVKVDRELLEKLRLEGKGKQYRKKPITIEAFQIDYDFSVETLEGIMIGKKGDYCIVGVRGEMYPCDESIFYETYDKVDDETNFE